MTAQQPPALLMLSHYFEERRGGIEIVAAALARELSSLGFAVVWLATGVADNECVRPGYRKRPLVASSVAEKVLGIPYPLLLPSSWRAVLRETARSDVVLVHDALYMTSLIGWLGARLHRKPLVIVQHVGFVPFRSALLRGLMRLANRWIATPLLRRADRALFISELTMRQFAEVRWRRAPALVFNGVDTGIFSPPGAREVEHARQALNLPNDVPIALFVGRFVEKKGLRVLESMARMRSDVLFAFAGGGSLDPRRWRLPNVRVYSDLSGPTLVPLYRASDLLLLPSTGEGFPLVVQEALACGLPVICGSDTARADSGAAGFLTGVKVEPARTHETAHRFSEELTRTLARKWTEVDQRERVEFVRERYSWATTATSYAAILRDVMTTFHGAQKSGVAFRKT
jgi:glycosyltransferase involved in cell wall biosynthesis